MDDPAQAQPEMSEKVSSRIYEEELRYVSPGLQEVAQLSRLVIREGRGYRLTDVDDRSYLDLMAGVAVCSLGHSHRRYIAAIKEQLEKVTGSRRAFNPTP